MYSLIFLLAMYSANKLLRLKISSNELIDKIKYEQWNGELPQVQGSSANIVDLTN